MVMVVVTDLVRLMVLVALLSFSMRLSGLMLAS